MFLELGLYNFYKYFIQIISADRIIELVVVFLQRDGIPFCCCECATPSI